MKKIKKLYYKVKGKIHWQFVLKNRNKSWYTWLYKSFFHSFLGDLSVRAKDTEADYYIAARPNPGAGIGHQISNWISGYTMSILYSCKFANIPFSSEDDPYKPNEWDDFLNFSTGEIDYCQLRKEGYKVVLLPLFDDRDERECQLIKKIINSYSGKRIFLLEQDQKIHDEITCRKELNDKFWSNKRYNEREKKIIVVHIRRGDIVQDQMGVNKNLSMRWLDNSYYYTVIEDLVKIFKNVQYEIYIFSQGVDDDFKEFQKIPNIHICLKNSAIDAFSQMTQADILVMSRSGFSYQASNLNKKGILIYPYGFWHTPVYEDRTIIPDSNGHINDTEMLKDLFNDEN